MDIGSARDLCFLYFLYMAAATVRRYKDPVV